MIRTRLRKNEQKVADVIALPIALILTIFFYLGRFLIKLLLKTKRWIYRLSIVFLILYSAYTTFSFIAYAPKAEAAIDGYNSVQHPTTEHEQIINYINEVFGKDAPNAFKILSCENSSLNPLSTGQNTNGSIDYGIFQINSVHGIPAAYLYNWKVNIDVAYQIFQQQGWTPWACETVYHVLDR